MEIPSAALGLLTKSFFENNLLKTVASLGLFRWGQTGCTRTPRTAGRVAAVGPLYRPVMGRPPSNGRSSVTCLTFIV